MCCLSIFSLSGISMKRIRQYRRLHYAVCKDYAMYAVCKDYAMYAVCKDYAMQYVKTTLRMYAVCKDYTMYAVCKDCVRVVLQKRTELYI